MQAVLIAEQQPDLYRFLAALAEVSYSYLSEPKLADKTHNANSVVIWSQGATSELLDSSEKIEIIERHARKLGTNIVLSAASNSALREWGKQVGWTVLWEVPGLDHAANAFSQNFEEQDTEDNAQVAC